MPAFSANLEGLLNAAVRRPGLAVAALVAPAFLSNDDRGYLQTAAVTTPLLGVGAYVSKGFFDAEAKSGLGFKGSVKDVVDAAKSAVSSKSSNEAAFASQAFSQQTPKNEITNLIQDFMNRQPKGTRKSNAAAKLKSNQTYIENYLFITPQREQEYREALDAVDRYTTKQLFLPIKGLAKDAKANQARYKKIIKRYEQTKELLAKKPLLTSNAIRSAELKALTTSEWADIKLSPDLLDFVLNNDQLLNTYKDFKDRPEFVSTLVKNLQRNKKMTEPINPIRKLGVQPTEKIFNTTSVDLNRGFLSKYSPKMQKDLLAAKKAGKFDHVKLVSFNNFDKPGDIPDSPVRLEFFNQKKEMLGDIYLPDENGMVTIHGRFHGEAVAQHIFKNDGSILSIEEFLTDMMANTNLPANELFAEIKKNQDAALVWFGNDASDSWKNAAIASSGSSQPKLSKLAAKLKRSVVKASPSAIYGSAQDQTWDKLARFDPKAFEGLVTGLSNSSQLEAMNAEKIYLGNFNLRDVQGLSTAGIARTGKQDSSYRSYSKPTKLQGNLEGNFNTTGQLALTEGELLPKTKLTVHSINPEHYQFFANLPQNSEISGHERFLNEYDTHYKKLTDELNFTPKAATKTMEDINKIYERGDDYTFKRFGQMGETELLIDESFNRDKYVTTEAGYRMDGIEVKEGQFVKKGERLGWNSQSFEPVVADESGYVGSIHEADLTTEELSKVEMTHVFGMDGAKLEGAGVKMIDQEIRSYETSTMTDVLRKFYLRGGINKYVPTGVNAFASTKHFANKVSAIEAQMNITADLYKRVFALKKGTGRTEALKEFAFYRLHNKSYVKFNKGELDYNTTFIMRNDQGKMRSNEEIAFEWEGTKDKPGLFGRTQKLHERIGRVLSESRGLNDPILSSAQRGVQAGADLSTHLLENSFTLDVSAWDHQNQWVSKNATITHDMITYAKTAGMPEVAKELEGRGRITGGGDTTAAIMYGHQIERSPNTPLGRVFDADKMPVTPKGSITKAIDREGSIFDPSMEDFKNNFSIKFNDGVKHEYFHLPGTETAGATGNMFGPRQYQTWDWQRKAREALNEKDVTAREKLIDETYQAYKEESLIGKESAFRPHMTDPLGATGTLRSMYDRDAGSFFAEVGPEYLEKIHDRPTREHIMSGNSTAILQRQPIETAYAVNVKYNPSRKGITIGAPTSLAVAYSADQDLDRVTLHHLPEGSAAEAEARRAMQINETTGISSQEARLRQRHATYSAGEDGMSVTESIKPLASRFEKEIAPMSNKGAEAIKSLAAGMIGDFTNIGTQLHEFAAASEDLMTNPNPLRQNIIDMHIGYLRQAGVNARKAPNFSLENAINLTKRFNRSMGHGDARQAAEGLASTMVKLHEMIIPDDHPGKAAIMETLNSQQTLDDYTLLMQARSEDVITRAKMLTTSSNAPVGKEILTKAYTGVTPNRARVGASGAEHATAHAAAVNEEIKSAGSVVMRDFKSAFSELRAAHGGKLAAGLAIATGLGILATPLSRQASFDESNANKHRPEERVGVPDRVPGEPIAGSRAPSNPVRDVRSPAKGTNTAVVAPLAQRVSLEARLKSQDKDAALEQAKLLSRYSGSGGSNSTSITYRNSTSNKSLRHRENVREAMA